ncbi:hypothetical protein Sjap_004597 [Stephania japonica]|uniref:Uncharacterized protein n=1 Tax=Stephania japonica TaxID=461633 RepID=A0AAP0K3T1_9MAGN
MVVTSLGNLLTGLVAVCVGQLSADPGLVTRSITPQSCGRGSSDDVSGDVTGAAGLEGRRRGSRGGPGRFRAVAVRMWFRLDVLSRGHPQLRRNLLTGLVVVCVGQLNADPGTSKRKGNEVKCTIPSLCSKGAKVVVTDHGEGDCTDFILSPRAFAKLALPNKVSELKKYGVVDIKYQKYYPGHNIKIKIHESSRYPDYLAILIIYKGGKSEITAVELLQGKQWDLPNPPKGPLTMRFQEREYGVQKWIPVWNTIPSYWKPGAAYDTNIQLPRT